MPTQNLPRLTRYAIKNKCDLLVKSLTSVTSSLNQIQKLQEFCKYLIHYPEASGFAVQAGALSVLLNIQQNFQNEKIKSYTRQALSLLGHVSPPKGRGIRILSIDGGGTKGVLMLEILKHIEKITGKQVYQLFDIIVGVSTGAILTMLLGAFRNQIEECDILYRQLSQQMFQRDVLRGTSSLILSHAYYDTSVWEKILKNIYSEKEMIDTSQVENNPKVVAISTIVNTQASQPFVFRNYNLPDGSFCYYEGSCKYKIWQAIRASAAAPGYFEEFVLDNYVHQDGGLIMNNPAAIAIHEAQLLWPNESIQACVSIGSGKYTPINFKKIDKANLTSLKTKISRFIESATDTETVHRLLQNLLIPGTYFRFNPTLTDYMSLDENRPEKLQQMQIDAQMYVRKNEFKLQECVKALMKQRTISQKIQDWIKLKYSIYQ